MKLDIVVLVCHHRVRGCAFAPAVAADTSVRVESLPRLNELPGVRAVIPCVLLKGIGIRGVPDVHAETFVKRSRVGIARQGRELGVVRVAIVVALPTCLETGAWRIIGLEIELAQRSGLPDVRRVRFGRLPHSVVLVNIEDVEICSIVQIHSDG